MQNSSSHMPQAARLSRKACLSGCRWAAAGAEGEVLQLRRFQSAQYVGLRNDQSLLEVCLQYTYDIML